MSVAPRNLLELTDVHTYYGTIHALKGISFDAAEGVQPSSRIHPSLRRWLQP